MENRTSPLSLSGWVTVVLGSACVLALLLQSVMGVQPTPFGRFVLAAFAIALLLGIDFLLHHAPSKPVLAVIIGSLIVHFVLIEAMTILDGFTYTAILYLTLPFPVFFRLGRRTGMFVSVGLLVWFTVKHSALKTGWLVDPLTTNTYLLFVISLILIVAMALVVLQERASRQRAENLLLDLEVTHQQLKSYAEQVAALATAEERNRLARDIHDSLGHALTVIGIQLEKALIVHDDSPTDTLKAVGIAKRLSDQALTDVRQSVGALRRDSSPFDFRGILTKLLANAEGLPFTIDAAIVGDETAYTTQQLMTLYRAIQEGLTNVYKHACARRVIVRLDLGDNEAVLTLKDDGIGFHGDPLQTNGFGLRGIKERLEAVSGRLLITTAPQSGTQLHVMIPQRRTVIGIG